MGQGVAARGWVMAAGPSETAEATGEVLVPRRGFVPASQGMFRTSNPQLALPGWIVVYGGAMSLLSSSAVRMMFPPAADQLRGAKVPADWLKRSGSSPGNPAAGIRVASFAA